MSSHESVACDLCGLDDAAPLLTKVGYRLVRCRGCGLVYVNPRPKANARSVEHNPLERADDPSWRATAVARAALLARYQPTRGRLLDVGYRTGWFVGVAREQAWNVVGLDLGVPSVAPLEEHKLPANSFDAVTMFDSIEHLPSPRRALQAVYTLLRDDGIVMITTPNVEGLFPRLTFGAWEPPAPLFRFGLRTLADALGRAGFEVVHDQTETIARDHPPANERGGERGLRRALRKVTDAGARVLASTLSVPAQWFDAGDSLVVLARKRR